ncbi:hypothetical protein G6L37_01195 [Agrobacterium rubi]|nr:hypothetical protein [Agrobacterium rubi]NTF24007.1 hypothetical protein [Agrobacterium rubi]
MKKLVIAAAIMAASASTAFADGAKDGKHPKAHGKFIEALDINKDGKVDATEFAAGSAERAGKRFDAIDKEGKGVISRDQFIAFAEAEAKTRFEKADKDGDGSLTREDRTRHGEIKDVEPKDDKPPEKAPG